MASQNVGYDWATVGASSGFRLIVTSSGGSGGGAARPAADAVPLAGAPLEHDLLAAAPGDAVRPGEERDGPTGAAEEFEVGARGTGGCERRRRVHDGLPDGEPRSRRGVRLRGGRIAAGTVPGPGERGRFV